jgi:superfamily II DNA/RNA helicase
MKRFLYHSSTQLWNQRVKPFSFTMQAVYSTSSLKQANAMPFKDLNGKLEPGILKALDTMRYEYMTPVQEKVLSSLPTFRTDW